ncbi:MAG: DUF362 domain-containing protein [Victivallaceae bacterium]|nr:DUF362 domain-containing protein [Victivallaceae bacterium]
MSIRATYASVSSYSPRELRDGLEKVFAPQLADFGGSLHGKSVLLKPNLLAWRREGDIACVHPAFLLEVARLFLDAGARRVSLRETPGCQSVESVLKGMGIDETLRHMNVDAAGFGDYQAFEAVEGMRFRNLELDAEFRRFDCVVDLAKVKTHGMMTLTLCVKNLFGMVRGSSRLGWHLAVGRDFGRFADMLLDLYLAVRPQFNFLDGIVAMEGNGPGSGSARALNFIAGASDALALDAATSGLLGVPDLLLLERARKRNLLPEGIEVCGMPPKLESPLILPDPPGVCLDWGVFLPPFCRSLLRRELLSRPELDAAKCVGCALCVKMCPPSSLRMGPDHRPVFHLDDCIRCYCCQEHCPQGAIRPRESRGMRLVSGVEKIIRKVF